MTKFLNSISPFEQRDWSWHGHRVNTCKIARKDLNTLRFVFSVQRKTKGLMLMRKVTYTQLPCWDTILLFQRASVPCACVHLIHCFPVDGHICTFIIQHSILECEYEPKQVQIWDRITLVYSPSGPSYGKHCWKPIYILGNNYVV